MKKILGIAFMLLAAVAMAACGSAPKLLSAQQVFEQACPIVNADLAIVASSTLLSAPQRDLLTTQIIPQNQAICAAGHQLNLTDLKTFHDSLLPAAVLIVQANPEIPNQPAVLLGLQTFGPLVQGLIDQFGAQITGAVTPASTPAASPLAASAIK